MAEKALLLPEAPQCTCRVPGGQQRLLPVHPPFAHVDALWIT